MHICINYMKILCHTCRPETETAKPPCASTRSIVCGCSFEKQPGLKKNLSPSALQPSEPLTHWHDSGNPPNSGRWSVCGPVPDRSYAAAPVLMPMSTGVFCE